MYVYVLSLILIEDFILIDILYFKVDNFYFLNFGFVPGPGSLRKMPDCAKLEWLAVYNNIA